MKAYVYRSRSDVEKGLGKGDETSRGEKWVATERVRGRQEKKKKGRSNSSSVHQSAGP